MEHLASLMAEITTTSTSREVRTGLEITARTAGASKSIEVEVDKPLDLALGQKLGGGVVITVSPPPPPLLRSCQKLAYIIFF